MFLITRYLIISIGVGFILHISPFFCPRLCSKSISPDPAKHPKVGRRFGVSVCQHLDDIAATFALKIGTYFYIIDLLLNNFLLDELYGKWTTPLRSGFNQSSRLT